MKMKWLDKYEKHDYEAAKSYLSPTIEHRAAKAAAEAHQDAEMTSLATKDTFRASSLYLLEIK